MFPEFGGNVPGPVSQVTLCVTEAAAHWNVTVPCVTVSGVGVKLLPPMPTVIVVVCPPGGGGGGGGGAGGGLLYPVLLPQAAATAIAAIASKRTIFITPPGGWTVGTTLLKCPSGTPGSDGSVGGGLMTRTCVMSAYWTTMIPLMLAPWIVQM